VGAETPRVAIRTLGCKVNRTESEALAETLLARGVVLSEDETGADLVVVNTCTVTGEADAKARKAARHALAASDGPVVITGCLAALDAEGLCALSPRVIVEPDKSRIGDAVLDLVGRGCGQAVARPVRSGPGFRTRPMVKVQDGCDRRCAYCIVPDARGLPRSVPAADVIERVRALAAAGAPEVVLTGINVGGYSDGPEVPDLAALVSLVADLGVGRVRISSIEPLDLTPRLLATLAASARIVPHLHIPLQSGCDATLEAMGRGYDTAAYAETLRLAREALPGLSVTTDVIVGFPGETDHDFDASLDFIEACGFSKLHVFRYSRRAGTPAAARVDQVPARVIGDRAASMRALGDRLAQAHASALVGGRTAVCIERTEGDRGWGMSDASLRAEVTGPGLAQGRVLTVAVESADGACLHGTVLESG
jgi:threonylcarbamoyladenosine tRNA methylthiotransferase MtaB